jgi:hypothetical protein
MIEELDRSMEAWLRDALKLGSRDAEISFERPEADWAQRRSVPMIDFFLYSLAPSLGRSAASLRTVRTEDGGWARQRDAPIMAARFLISVWSSDPAIEHDLLARVAHLLTSSRQIPPRHVTPALAAMRPAPSLSTRPDEETTVSTLWQSLEVPARVATQLLVEMPVGKPEVTTTNDPPDIVEIGFANSNAPAARSSRRRVFGTSDPSMAGGTAIGSRGSAVVQDSGRYLIDAQPGDEIVVEPPAPDGDGDG